MNNRIRWGTTPTTRKSPFEFRNKDRRRKNHVRDRQIHTHTGRTPTEGAPKQAFLGVGSAPLGLNKNVPTVTTMATMVAVELDGTCEIPERWVCLVNMGKMLIPLESEDIGTWWGYWGEPIDGLVLVRVHFDRHMPTVITNGRAVASVNEVSVMCNGHRGGGVTAPSSSSIFEDPCLVGVSSPRSLIAW
jgi:hypothetical protein